MLVKASLCLLTLALVINVGFTHMDKPIVYGGFRGIEEHVDEEATKVVRLLHHDIEDMALQKYKWIHPITMRKSFMGGMVYFIKAHAKTIEGVRSFIHIYCGKPIREPPILYGILLNQDKDKKIELFSQ